MSSTTLNREHGEQRGAQCEFCAGKSFRRSHLQVKDLLSLLLFRYPVRCMSCSKRQAVSLLLAQRATSSAVKQVRTARAKNEWSGWNSSDREAGRTVVPGGHAFSALPVHAPISMPELRGLTLESADDVAGDNKNPV